MLLKTSSNLDACQRMKIHLYNPEKNSKTEWQAGKETKFFN